MAGVTECVDHGPDCPATKLAKELMTVTITACPIDGEKLGSTEVREIFHDVEELTLDLDTGAADDWEEEWDNDGDTRERSFYGVECGHTLKEMAEYLKTHRTGSGEQTDG